MKYFYEPIYRETFLCDRVSVLSIPGILPQSWKLELSIPIGRAWPKRAQNGREYIKLRLDAFRTRLGKPLYAKAWQRKLEPNLYDLYADDRDFPVTSLCSLIVSDLPPQMQSLTA